MLLGVFQVRVAGRAVELDAAKLVGQFLRMHERQEEKAALVLRHVLVVAALERAIGGRARERIGREGARVAAEHVARELVEHDHQRERVFGGRLPGGKLAGRGGLIGREEFLADLGVERVVAREPFVRPGLAPEGEDVGGGGEFFRSCRSSRACCRRSLPSIKRSGDDGFQHIVQITAPVEAPSAARLRRR